jgi:hypothetical protein
VITKLLSDHERKLNKRFLVHGPRDHLFTLSSTVGTSQIFTEKWIPVRDQKVGCLVST